MSSAHLHLHAQSAEDLLTQLAAIDISVPLSDEGRTTPHRERYMVARLLSTLADSDFLQYPLRLEHREKPDFGLFSAGSAVGIECVEATHEEWAQIQAVRDRDFPEELVFLPMLRPGQTTFTMEERVEIASGVGAGPPWVGKMAENQWADAMVHFIAKKTEKLRKGNYSEFATNWLVIQDEWPVPLYYPEKRVAAAGLCIEAARPFLEHHCFSHIFIGDSSGLIHLTPQGASMLDVRDLWR